MTNNFKVALAYAQCGVNIIPCRESRGDRSGAKAPYVAGGLHSASAEEPQIREWWRTWPHAAIGLPCRLNKLIAIDADRHGHEDGVSALMNLCAHNSFNPMSAPLVETPAKGMHLIFKRPEKLEQTVGKLSSAVDVRDNAYVIAAGSVMADGRQYLLRNGSVDMLAAGVSSGSLPQPPSWLIATLEKPPLGVERNKNLEDWVLRPVDVERRLEGLVRSVITSAHGQRNNTLHWAACRAGEMIRGRIISRDVASATLFEAGIRAGLSRQEVVMTIKSGLGKSNVVLRP